VKLSAFIPRLDYLSSLAFIEELARDLAYECKVNLVPDEFHTESDPYGTPWKPQKKPQNRILYKTGDLFNSFSIYANANGVRITNAVPYAAVHQYGSAKKNIPARRMLPSTKIGFGEMWLKGIRRVYKKAIKEALKR